VLADDDLADALAQADLDVRSAGEISAVLVAEGDPGLRAGGRVRVAGIASELEGTYTVTEAVHTIDAAGYETTLSTRPPQPPSPRRADVVTLGVVDRVDDPESRGRAQVRLVAYPDLVTGWAPVLLSAAGPDKGVVALPDAGDTVLVVLPGGDPAHAVVLGALLGEVRTHDADDAGPRGGRYSVRTAGGQRVVLDQDARSVVLTDGHGSSVELGPDRVRVTAATDLVLEAPGHALTVRARSVDFEEAP
jgi:phage baseplate assembly protein V